MFYGRKKELMYLEECYNSNKAEFITIYGRRRIGKTELLKHFVKEKTSIFYSAKICTDYEQLLSFSEKVLGKGRTFQSWEASMEYIHSKTNSDEKTILILDEFPYMVKGNKGLPSILQNIWDHLLSECNIMIILCGSSMSFIEKDILSEKNPLYGRMTGIYKVNELDIEESASFFPNYSNEQIIEMYSILGGVPYYYLQFDSDRTIKENIKKNILNKGRVLFNEVELLIQQELREPQIYYTIIEKIAMGNTKLNEIYNKTLIEKNKLSVYLKNLIELNVICKEYPITEKLKSKVNLHSGIYKLANNYFDFYFRFIFPNLSEIEEGDVDGVFEFEIEPYMSEYVSKFFENVCIRYIFKKNVNRELPFRVKKVGRWWNKQDEIDVVAYDGYNNYIWGECKWRNEKMGVEVLNKLKNKADRNFDYKQGYFFLFSKSGFTQELFEIGKESKNVNLVSLEQVMRL